MKFAAALLLALFCVGSSAGGELTYLGAWPEYIGRAANATVVQLPDGRLFMYGVRVDRLPNSNDTSNRRRAKITGSLLEDPRLWNPRQQAWKKFARPPECPHNHLLATVTRMLDGRVLVAGGICDSPRMGDDVSPYVSYKLLSLWNSATGLWEAAPALSTGRKLHSASLLKDGSVLLVGGQGDVLDENNREPALDTVERFHMGKVERLMGLQTPRAAHTASLLGDGTLMVTGGLDAMGKPLASVEFWNPASGTWRSGAPLKQARHSHSATLLGDGRVLVAGGVGDTGQPLASVEIWNPTANEWKAGPPLLVAVYGQEVALLADGNLLLAGGVTQRNQSLRETMMWDKASGDWELAGRLQSRDFPTGSLAVALLPLPDGGARVFAQSEVWRWMRSDSAAVRPAFTGRVRQGVTALADGRILVSGGVAENGSFLDATEVFDPATGRFAATGRMSLGRHSHSTLLLDDGSVLAAGGWARAVTDQDTPAAHSPQLWSPATGQWRVVSEIRFDWRDWVRMTRLADGWVLFFASRELFEDAPTGPVEFRAWLWNPASAEVAQKNVPIKPRRKAIIALKPNGDVLVASGDEAAQQWREADLWNARSGAVSRTSAPPERYMRDPQAIVLRNGNVAVADYQQLGHPANGVPQAPVLLWNATSGVWSQLPALVLHEARELIELADGTLVTKNMRLAPGASEWTQLRQVQAEDARPMVTPAGRLMALGSVAPYLSSYNRDAASWEVILPDGQPPIWRGTPALAPMADGRLMLVADVESSGQAVQNAFIWDRAHSSWSRAGALARRYNEGQAAALPSGRVLHLGLLQAGQNICELWDPKDNRWTFCGTLTAQDPKAYNPLMRPLADGRLALPNGLDSALVFDEAAMTWVRMKLELNDEKLAYGAPLRPQKGFYARVFDEGQAGGRWIDASALSATHLAQGGPNISPPSVLWDERKKHWAYVLPRFDGLGRQSVMLPDGCALSLVPPRLFNWHTGKVTPLDNPGLGPEFAMMVMSVLADGTVVAVPADSGIAGVTGIFARKASCAGFESRPGDELLMPDRSYTSETVAPAPVPAAPPGWSVERIRQSALSFAYEYKWLALAVAFPILLWALLNYAVLPAGRAVWRWVAPAGSGTTGRPWSGGFRWTIRIIFYGCVVALVKTLVG
ncbi:MAG: hypothetical protein H7293_01035 [Candidatus Saccharibacteria bacterium]|nr:hypothetical protein [Rhodoferax sp.]